MMQALSGSLVALVTPMNLRGEVDFNSLERLIEWHIVNGTHGIVSVGTTGESATLKVDEHLRVIEHTVKCVNGRIPVIAGSGSNSTAQAIETTTESKRIGADFSLLVTPYYNRPSQKGLIEHFVKIVEDLDTNIPIRLNTVNWNGQSQVITLDLDEYFWPSYGLIRNDGTWSRYYLN